MAMKLDPEVVRIELTMITNAVLAIVHSEDPRKPGQVVTEQVAITSQAQLVRLINNSFRKVI